MQRAWTEIKAGWGEARWSLHFGLFLLPTSLVAVLLAYAIEGKVSSPPSVLEWCLLAPAVLVSFIAAGLLDGPDGQIGATVWRVTFLITMLWLIERAVRAVGTPQRVSVKVGEYGFTVELTASTVREVAEAAPWERGGTIEWCGKKDTSKGGVLTPG